MNIKNILSRRARMLKKGIYPIRDLAVLKSMYLSDILKHLDYDQFHIIHVVDAEFKVCAAFTEQEILNFMVEKEDLTFEQLINTLSKA